MGLALDQADMVGSDRLDEIGMKNSKKDDDKLSTDKRKRRCLIRV